MSRAESGAAARTKILEAAAARGAAEGVGALSLQGIATAAGVSKPLVLYHFGDKDGVLRALGEALVAADVAELTRAVAATDVLEGWRALARDAEQAGRRALLAALQLEAALRDAAGDWHHRRLAHATTLATAILRSAGLAPRHAPPLLGTMVLHQLDGLAASVAGAELAAAASDARQDVFALALLALGD